jgi:hypothetical protein
MRKSSFSFFICIVLCFSTTTVSAEEQPFDVSDVSFLIPPSTRSVHLAGGSDQRPLLSRETFLKFDDFINRGHPQMTGDEVYNNLVVTGIRFDPCGPKYPTDWDIQKCVLPNLRVITQVYKGGRTANAALHMVFLLRPLSDLGIVSGRPQPTVPLDPAMRNGVISRLVLMKSGNSGSGISTNGTAAGIHPVFGHIYRNSARVAAFETELKSLLEEYCAEDRYFFTAVMFTDESYGSSNSGQERWVWQKANVVHSPGGKIELRFGGIPGFSPELKEQTLTADRDRRSGVTVFPPSTLPEKGVKNAEIEAILKYVEDIDHSKLPSAVDATDRLENPDIALVQTDDCVSCHVTTTAREYVTHSLTVDSSNRALQYEFKAEPRLTSTLDDIQYLLQRSNTYRVMSFAFFNGTPSVNQRTVHESLQAAHVVNLIRK